MYKTKDQREAEKLSVSIKEKTEAMTKWYQKYDSSQHLSDRQFITLLNGFDSSESFNRFVSSYLGNVWIDFIINTPKPTIQEVCYLYIHRPSVESFRDKCFRDMIKEERYLRGKK